MRHRTLLLLPLLMAPLAACAEESEPPEYAEPADTIAPAPTQDVIPQTDEPGPQ